jgi:hypothetical protein
LPLSTRLAYSQSYPCSRTDTHTASGTNRIAGRRTTVAPSAGFPTSLVGKCAHTYRTEKLSRGLHCGKHD